VGGAEYQIKITQRITPATGIRAEENKKKRKSTKNNNTKHKIPRIIF
jgi:hypothetical protein